MTREGACGPPRPSLTIGLPSTPPDGRQPPAGRSDRWPAQRRPRRSGRPAGTLLLSPGRSGVHGASRAAHYGSKRERGYPHGRLAGRRRWSSKSMVGYGSPAAAGLPRSSSAANSALAARRAAADRPERASGRRLAETLALRPNRTPSIGSSRPSIARPIPNSSANGSLSPGMLAVRSTEQRSAGGAGPCDSIHYVGISPLQSVAIGVSIRSARAFKKIS